MRLAPAIIAFVLALAGLSGRAAAEENKNCRDAETIPVATYYGQIWLQAGLPAGLARQALDLRWPQEARNRVDLFPAKEMLAAINAFGDLAPPVGDRLEFEDY